MSVDQELREFVQTVADAAPEAPLVGPSRQPQRRVAPVAALAGGFVAVMLVVGLGTAILMQGLGTERDAGAGSDTTGTTIGSDTPPTTLGVGEEPAVEVNKNSAEALALQSLVDAALTDGDFGATVSEAYSTDPLSDAMSVVAVVKDEADTLILVVDYQTLAPGEDWEAQLTDTEVGESTDYGRYFAVEAVGDLRQALLITPEGILTVAVDSPQMAAEMGSDGLRAFTLSIGEGMSVLGLNLLIP